MKYYMKAIHETIYFKILAILNVRKPISYFLILYMYINYF